MSLFLVLGLTVVLVATLWTTWNLYVQTQRFNEVVDRCERSAAPLRGEAGSDAGALSEPVTTKASG